VNIKELERRLAKAERQANAWGINDRLRERREDEVAALRAELADAYATR
jgi:hypothetical protein